MSSDWFQVIFLGFIEGVTEFLPVSSTGHLLLAEAWLGTARSELFNTVIQSGAVLAVLAVFAGRVRELLTHWREPESRDYIGKLALAFVLTAVGGLTLKKLGFTLPKTPQPVAWATLVGGLLFVAVEAWLGKRTGKNEVTWAIAVAVAAGQLLAIAYPGASRSGSTILIALVLGLSRPAAAEFSFLLGIPTLLAAGAKETLDALKDQSPHEPWSQILVGTLVAAITAFAVVRWLLGYVRNHSFAPFGWYRIALGTLILLRFK